MESIKDQNEIGFKIEEIKDKGHEFEVIIEPPLPQNRKTHYKFSKDGNWREEKKYVLNGEVHEDPRWLLKIKNNIKERIESEQKGSSISSLDLKEHEGDRISVDEYGN